jgi:hypothetical protein
VVRLLRFQTVDGYMNFEIQSAVTWWFGTTATTCGPQFSSNDVPSITHVVAVRKPSLAYVVAVRNIGGAATFVRASSSSPGQLSKSQQLRRMDSLSRDIGIFGGSSAAFSCSNDPKVSER